MESPRNGFLPCSPDEFEFLKTCIFDLIIHGESTTDYYANWLSVQTNPDPIRRVYARLKHTIQIVLSDAAGAHQLGKFEEYIIDWMPREDHDLTISIHPKTTEQLLQEELEQSYENGDYLPERLRNLLR